MYSLVGKISKSRITIWVQNRFRMVRMGTMSTQLNYTFVDSFVNRLIQTKPNEPYRLARTWAGSAWFEVREVSLLGLCFRESLRVG